MYNKYSTVYTDDVKFLSSFNKGFFKKSMGVPEIKLPNYNIHTFDTQREEK